MNYKYCPLDPIQDTSVVPANRLANIYAESKEFLVVKQHLDQKLKVAINEPVGETPEFATNFLWQVNLHICVCSMYIFIMYIHIYYDIYDTVCYLYDQCYDQCYHGMERGLLYPFIYSSY